MYIIIFKLILFIAYLCDQFLLTAYPDRGKLDFAYFTKRPAIGDALKKLDKISVWEPKVSVIKH